MSSTRANRTLVRWRSYWALAVVAAACLGLLTYNAYGGRQRVPLRIDEPSPQTFIAPVTTQVEDEFATVTLRQVVREQVPEIYSVDRSTTDYVVTVLNGADLPRGVAEELAEAYRAPGGVKRGGIPALIDRVLAGDDDPGGAARLTLQKLLVPNAVPDDRLTAAARDAAAKAVPTVMQTLAAGQVIVEAGEPLSEVQLSVLDSLGLYDARADAATQTAWIVVGVILLTLLLSSPLLFTRELLVRELTFKKLAFLAALTLGTLLLQRLAVFISPHFLFALLIPLMVSALFGARAGVLVGAWLSVALGVLTPSSPLIAAVATLVGATAASLVSAAAKNRIWLLMAGAAGGVTGGLTLLGLMFAGGGMSQGAAVAASSLLLAGGLLAGLLALGLLPVAESVFGFLTEFRLIELSSPTQPLLRRLIAEAPGTYQHSLIISNLVEQATSRVGGNALLARVAALYHDVGKIKRPHFFVENQFTGDNPHDRMSPHLSYLIITSHVRDGLDLLRANQLPTELEPYVAEHHGTTVLSYFYKRALEEGQVEELNFRYSGPKPQSKETAILMLADAVESASRTLVDTSPSSIRALIDRLIQQRQQDGQLSDAPLTFQDLDVIASTFARMLSATLHRRVSYPSPEEVTNLRKTRAAQQAHAGAR